jgi:acyl-CoA synthetase (AMP-forming)/AMP-acid ligase II
MNVAASAPIIVGVGQFTERLDARDYKGLSAYEIAAAAARNAIDDARSMAALGMAHRCDRYHTHLRRLDGEAGDAIWQDRDVIGFCNQRLGDFKVPKGVVLSEALPKNPNGKLHKRELRKQLQKHFAG